MPVRVRTGAPPREVAKLQQADAYLQQRLILRAWIGTMSASSPPSRAPGASPRGRAKRGSTSRPPAGASSRSSAPSAGPPSPARRGRPRSERELAGHDVLLHGGELAALPESKWLASRPGVRVVLRTSSMTALFAATADGAGLAMITGPWGERELGLV